MPDDPTISLPAAANDGAHLLARMDVAGAMRDMFCEVFGEERARQILADQAEREKLLKAINKMDPGAMKRFRGANVQDQNGVSMIFVADNDVSPPGLHEMRTLLYAVKDEQRAVRRQAEEDALFAPMAPTERARFIARAERHSRRESSRGGRLVNDALAFGSHALEVVRHVMEVSPSAQFVTLMADWRRERALTAVLRKPYENSPAERQAPSPPARSDKASKEITSNKRPTP